MKKLFIILLSVLSLTSFSQNKKTVAVLDPICRDNSVNGFYQLTVRGAMETAVTMSEKYEAYDRSAFDQIQKEQAFECTGAVSDSQIKKMGEMAGVDYVLVSEVSTEAGYLSAVFKILNVTTGKYDNSKKGLMKLDPEIVNAKCDELASLLFGAVPSGTSTSKKQVPFGFVDLGLPSGTLWKNEDEEDYMDFEASQKKYGSSIPTKEQWEELINNCTMKWIEPGEWVEEEGYFPDYQGDPPYCIVTGKNGNSIKLTSVGYVVDNLVIGGGYFGGLGLYYLSSSGKDNTEHYLMTYNKDGADISIWTWEQVSICGIRLVY